MGGERKDNHFRSVWVQAVCVLLVQTVFPEATCVSARKTGAQGQIPIKTKNGMKMKNRLYFLEIEDILKSYK